MAFFNFSPSNNHYAPKYPAKNYASAPKASKVTANREAFDADYPGVGEFLAKAVTWNSPSDFICSLHASLVKYGRLTDNQAAAVKNTMAKIEANRAAKVAAAVEVDLSPIRAMFETAVANGYKRPIYRAADLVISRAPMTGKNPGALYVKTVGDEYLGKLVGTTYTGRPAPALAAIALDPKGEAIKYGQRTGTCSCCGRELTAEASIEAGIGPICAEKWGL